MKRFTVVQLVICLFHAISFHGQEIKNEDLIYDDNILSIQLYRAGNTLNPAVLRLGTNDKLMLSFDDMSNETYRFRYTFIHCDRNWNPSGLEPFEYLEGFNEDEIEEYQFSVNAIPSFIHYEKVLPNRNMGFKLSGNYILKVYLDDPSDENVLFTRRFFVVEQLTTINTEIPYYPKRLEYTRKKQQIDLQIATPDLFNAEPMQRIKVTIQQNGRWDNAITNLKPTGVSMHLLYYDYPDGIVFDGGNDFRHFNMESYWYKSMYIRDIISTSEGYDVILHTEGSRKNREYETLGDMNGKRVIQARKEQNTDTEGEYATVFFSLKIPEIQNADVYILGQLNDWQLDDQSRMTYDRGRHMYTGNLFLKQGYYEYNYVVKKPGNKKADITEIEGDNWEADNDYTVYVYYHEKVPEYDRLVGYKLFNSRLPK